jgi:uncharacterized peroxidase-related enzyme
LPEIWTRRYRFVVARLPFTDPGENLGVNIFRVMNNAPMAAKGYSSLGSRLLTQTSLDPKLRELVINAVSLKLDCPYEWSHHGKWALDVGVSREQLEALKNDDYSALGDLERACVEYALKLEANDVSDADIDALRNVGLDDQQIVEITVVAGFYGMTARFLNAMDVDYDEGNPQNFALPDEAGASRARRSVEGDR